MSISLQEQINLRAESYRIRSKNFGEWVASLSESSIVSTELVELIIGLLDHTETTIDNGIDVILNCHDAILSHWVNYDFVVDEHYGEPLDFNEVMLSNPVPVLKFINAYYDILSVSYEDKDKVAIVSHQLCGYGYNDTDAMKDFMDALEYNATTLDKNEWRYVDYGGMRVFRAILINITEKFVSKVNDCPEYRAWLGKWNKDADKCDKDANKQQPF